MTSLSCGRSSIPVRLRACGTAGLLLLLLLPLVREAPSQLAGESSRALDHNALTRSCSRGCLAVHASLQDEAPRLCLEQFESRALGTLVVPLVFG